MNLLEVRAITRRFGGLTAVDGVSFDVHEGEIKAIIGPNGAGKSTLFNALTGFDRPDEGSVKYGGVDLVGMRPDAVVRAGIARTFQNTQLFEDMTAHDNVMVGTHAQAGSGFFAAAIRDPRVMRAERVARQEAERLLRLLGLGEWADAPAADMPHGLRRSLEIARALATSPRLLLLDEPAAGLNTTETAALAEALFRIRDRGVTLVVVEHDMGLVMEVSDEIVVLDRGRKIAEGPPRLIQKDPAVIAAYLGEEDPDDV
ncbi:MAG: ABC transporter ATP-binding protein [Actinomycetota bacterium]|nr:ABC transporter ATP-binding protein [Actinomycetota bacterium]MDZ4178267.1 ABC transporter ATP-binding protein [Coriobacteriia bacterium]